MNVCQIITSFTLFVCKFFCVEVQHLVADRQQAFDDRIELLGAVTDTKTRSAIDCLALCLLNDMCLTFFYNKDSQRCVMHSKDFIFGTPGNMETGWKHYVTKDVSGRCPPPMYHYRNLDFCYVVDTIILIDIPKIKQTCNSTGTTMATITSQEKQDYFSHIMTGRLQIRVCLNGHVNSNKTITLDDGSAMSYYNWAPGQPDKLSYEWCLLMYTEDLWYNIPCVYAITIGCTFVCELK